MCHLTIYRKYFGLLPKRPAYGSAVLYKQRYLLTAAHNIYDPFYNGIDRVEVRCGQEDVRDMPAQQTVDSEHLATSRNYNWKPFNGDEFQRDFGVIKLENPITGKMPYQLAEAFPAIGTPILLAGYPGGENSATELFIGKGATRPGYGKILKYNLRTFTGNSGGPVWNISGEIPELAAIHVSQSAGRGIDTQFAEEIDYLIGILDSR